MEHGIAFSLSLPLDVPRGPALNRDDSRPGCTPRPARRATACRAGALIDLHCHFGSQRRAVGHDELMPVLHADKITITTGDIVCLHTGFADLAMSLRPNDDHSIVRAACTVLDGVDEQEKMC